MLSTPIRVLHALLQIFVHCAEAPQPRHAPAPQQQPVKRQSCDWTHAKQLMVVCGLCCVATSSGKPARSAGPMTACLPCLSSATSAWPMLRSAPASAGREAVSSAAGTARALLRGCPGAAARSADRHLAAVQMRLACTSQSSGAVHST